MMLKEWKSSWRLPEWWTWGEVEETESKHVGPPKDKSCLKHISVCGFDCDAVTELRCDCVSLLWQQPFVFETTIVLGAVLKSLLWRSRGLHSNKAAAVAQKKYLHQNQAVALTGLSNSHAKMTIMDFVHSLWICGSRCLETLCALQKHCISFVKFGSQCCLETILCLQGTLHFNM